jgi:hypothetical protein
VPALKRGGLVCACALLVAGCTSFVRLDSPRTVPPGHREVMVGLSGYTDDRKDSNLFNTDLLLRWGLTDRTDVGLRFNLVGVATDLKWQLVRATASGRGLELAIAPSMGWGADISWASGSGGNGGNDLAGGWQVGLPLLMGIDLGPYQLVVTPQLLYQRIPVLPDGILNFGGTVAFGRMSGPGFSLYPAIAVWKALDPRAFFTSLRGPGAVAVQPALVFHWGR